MLAFLSNSLHRGPDSGRMMLCLTHPFLTMNLKPLVLSVLALLAWSAPVVYGDEPRECAYTETMLCSDVAPGDAALFERYFGSSADPVTNGWDAENLVSYHSSWCRNRAGRRLLAEWITVYSEDGSTMRKLTCERFKDTPDIRRNYQVREYRAVVPFVFINNLVRVVDFQDETLYVSIFRFNPETRSVREVVNKQWSRSDFNAIKCELTEEEKALFDTYFPRNKRRQTPPTWDAARRVLYSATGRGGSRGAYALNGIIKWVAEDGSSCRIATKTLEASGAWKNSGRPTAYQLPMVQPFVFVEAPSFDIIFHIEQFNPQTGVYEGTRTKVYDFRSLELLSDTWTPCAPSAN